jgi:hypothetical protein
MLSIFTVAKRYNKNSTKYWIQCAY